MQSLHEELQQKEVQLSRSNRDLQSLESELQQTRHAMYSEQAQIANLQAQVGLTLSPVYIHLYLPRESHIKLTLK